MGLLHVRNLWVTKLEKHQQQTVINDGEGRLLMQLHLFFLGGVCLLTQTHVYTKWLIYSWRT